MSDELAFGLKGAAAIVGLVTYGYVLHRTTELGFAQAARYAFGLVSIGAVAFASQEQFREGAVWESRQWGGVAIIVSCLIASIASVLEDRGITLRSTRRGPRICRSSRSPSDC